MGFITSKFDGHCRQCNGQIRIGEQVWWVRGTRGVKCQSCVNQLFGSQGYMPHIPPPAQTYQHIHRASTPAWRSQVSSPTGRLGIPIGMDWAEALLPTPVVAKLPQLIATALVALEEVILESAITTGMSPELKSGWDKYQKLKASALRPGSTTEEKQAFKLALIHALKLAPLT